MRLEEFYLICFVVGVILSTLSFMLGSVHLPVHWHIHLPGFGDAHPHVHLGHAPGTAHGGMAGANELPLMNFATITAFLAWFGGVGYLLTRYSNLYAAVGLVVALVAGVTGASLAFLLIAKVLMPHNTVLDPLDYDMVGVLGKVTSTIRADGVGEIIFSQEGTRKSAGARSDTGAPIAKGVEVVVTRYERGIAYVRPWEEMSGTVSDTSAANSGL